MEIILAGEKITAVSTAQRRTRLEFGGLYYSRNSKVKLDFIRKITRKFKAWKVKRLDFACDIKTNFESLDIDTPDKYFMVTEDHWSSYYFNKVGKSETLTYYVYDRSNRIKLFSFSLTRIEVRIFKTAVDNRNLSMCLQEDAALTKCASLVEKLFENLNIQVGARRVKLKMNAKETLQNLVEFLESDSELPKDDNLFRLQRSLGIRDLLEAWMKLKGVTWKSLPRYCWKKKALVCNKIGFSQPILRKAINFSKENY